MPFRPDDDVDDRERWTAALENEDHWRERRLEGDARNNPAYWSRATPLCSMCGRPLVARPTCPACGDPEEMAA